MKRFVNILVWGFVGAAVGLFIGFAIASVWSCGWIMYWGGESRGRFCDVKRTGDTVFVVVSAVIFCLLFIKKWGLPKSSRN